MLRSPESHSLTEKRACFDTVVRTTSYCEQDSAQLSVPRSAPSSLPHFGKNHSAARVTIKKFRLQYQKARAYILIYIYILYIILQPQTIDKISHYLPPPTRRANACGPKHPLQPGQVAEDQNLGLLLALCPVGPKLKPTPILATGTTFLEDFRATMTCTGNLKMGMSEKCYEA